MGLSTYLRELRFRTDLPYRLYDRLVLLLRQFGGRHPLRRATDDARPPPFFIVGSGRSGNTLLRAILAGSQELAIPPESYVLGPVVRDYRRLGFLPWRELLRVVLARFRFQYGFQKWDIDLGEIHDELARCPDAERSLARILDAVYQAWARHHMPAATRWGDKTPTNVYHLPRIEAVFPRARFVHVLRDGRDVVASYLEAGFYRSAAEACDRWLESVELVRSFSRRLSPERFLEVRYEQLVREPEAVTREVSGFLGISYEPRMLKHRERVDKLGDTEARHHAGLQRPISDRSVGSWRERLDSRQRADVQERLSATLTEFDYPSGGGTTGLADRSGG